MFEVYGGFSAQGGGPETPRSFHSEFLAQDLSRNSRNHSVWIGTVLGFCLLPFGFHDS